MLIIVNNSGGLRLRFDAVRNVNDHMTWSPEQNHFNGEAYVLHQNKASANKVSKFYCCVFLTYLVQTMMKKSWKIWLASFKEPQLDPFSPCCYLEFKLCSIKTWTWSCFVNWSKRITWDGFCSFWKYFLGKPIFE